MSKTTETDTFRRLKAFMKDVDGDHCQIIKYPPIKGYSLSTFLPGFVSQNNDA